MSSTTRSLENSILAVVGVENDGVDSGGGGLIKLDPIAIALAEELDIFVIVYLDEILIHTKDPVQGRVKAVRCMWDVLRKHGPFANLKKGEFHKNKIRFLGYVVSAQGLQIEDKRIEAMKNGPEPKSTQDIQVFIGFTNFY